MTEQPSAPTRGSIADAFLSMSASKQRSCDGANPTEMRAHLRASLEPATELDETLS